MRQDVLRATLWGLSAALLLAIGIIAGSRDLAHFDAALVGYTFATLFATFGITYRYAMWLQRPPTAVYWRRGWQVFLDRRFLVRNLLEWPRRVTLDVAATTFIWQRSRLRWFAHMLIMWGCIVAAAITFPLVFGWLHFIPVADNPEWYRIVLFGLPTIAFPVESWLAFFVFHGLVWASFLVIAGVMLAMRRRMRNEGAVPVQRFVEDFLPLVLLFAISITGLMLTASYTWMGGFAYTFLAILHALTVIFTLLYLPFGKFFHIFQRPAQLAIRFYKHKGEHDPPAHCRRCNHPFTSEMKVHDLIATQRGLGFSYEMEGDVEHYQWICPPCRRAMFALSQGRLWNGSRGVATGPVPMPAFVNPGAGEGPLGHEDARNFHP